MRSSGDEGAKGYGIFEAGVRRYEDDSKGTIGTKGGYASNGGSTSEFPG